MNAITSIELGHLTAKDIQVRLGYRAAARESFADAKHRHADSFDCADLCECITPEVLEALKDGDEMYAGFLLRREMLGLIEARATYGCDE